MGAWGAGHFDNDDARDWLWTLEEAKDVRLLERTLAPVARAGRWQRLDAPAASCALAAAAVVAGTELPEEAASWRAEHGDAVGRELVELGRGAVARVRKRSELRTLWHESGAAEWLEHVDALQRALGG